MGVRKRHILKCFSVLFVAALLYPLLLQAVHNFDYHEHTACSEGDTHFHEIQIECELHDLFLASCDFDLNSYDQSSPVDIIANSAIVTKFSFFYSEATPLFFLRGPPSHS